MKTTGKINPKLKAIVNNIAAQIYVADNGKSRKDFDKAYDEAIKRVGYSPAYFKSCISKFNLSY